MSEDSHQNLGTGKNGSKTEKTTFQPKDKLTIRLRRYFLTGVVVTAPIAITVYVTWWFLKLLDSGVAQLIPLKYNPNTYLPFSLPGLGLLLSIVFFVLVGSFARNFIGQMIIRVSEYVVNRMPVMNTVYATVKQVFEMTVGDRSKAFREVVLFEYPRPGIWVMGFVTGTAKGEVQSRTEEEIINIFLPTTPNPTSGFLLFIPRKDVITLSMSVEDAVKLIVSGGIIAPGM
jgi:uncharacterized membrane protein